MKKFFLLCGLASIVVSGALAQGNSGFRTQYAGVGISVDTYMNLSPIITNADIVFHVTDGGYGGPYPSPGPKTFNATSNVAYKLTASVTMDGNKYTVQSKLDSSAWATVATLPGQTVTPGRAHTVDTRLLGNPVTGLPPDLYTDGLLTVTITAN